MRIEDRIDKLAMRQEALIAAIHGLADVVETMRDMQAEFIAWIQQPPSTDMADLLQELAAAVHDNSTVIGELARRIEALPEQLTR
jgi:hypothetical protein